MKFDKDNVRSILGAATKNPITRNILKLLCQQGILPGTVWKRLPIEGEIQVALPNGQTFRYSSIVEEGIGRALFWRGWDGYEPEMASVFYKLASTAQVVVDVGAHTGLYTLIACSANSETQVVAFEPVPFIFDRLRNHVYLNEFENRCSLYPKAVSNNLGRTILHVPFGEQPVSASLHSNGFITQNGFQIGVDVTSLDAVCSNYDSIDLVKIDAEGFEDKVLEGMETLIARFRPSLVIECMPDGPFRQVDRLLKTYGYTVYHLAKTGLRAVTSIEPQLNRQYPNYLCVIGDLPESLKL